MTTAGQSLDQLPQESCATLAEALEEERAVSPEWRVKHVVAHISG